MDIRLNTDKNIEGKEALAAQVEAAVERALRHFDDQITRVEVHLSDENAGKFGRDDKRCLMEARLEGRQPVAVTHQAGSLSEAVDGAANKLKSLLTTALGRLGEH
ncbi:MAG TPA: HPF/RaiA family ribosome-associated protein [Rhodocyclaceae bacterium]|jgi:ribosome-associated translation inhibitor RaiA|nr:HPF/RaiA family ribosome-associated protein [Rhodocyclaceae bacterium]